MPDTKLTESLPTQFNVGTRITSCWRMHAIKRVHAFLAQYGANTAWLKKVKNKLDGATYQGETPVEAGSRVNGVADCESQRQLATISED
jgi:hypothetical protein